MLALLLAVLPQATPATAEPARPPDLVVILADDLGWRDLGCMGSDYYDTPHIDALAAAGISFHHAYSNGPNCAPSRASLITDTYGPRHGIYTVGNAARGDAALRRLVPITNTTTLRRDLPTLPAMLRAAGYRTAVVGKWHLSDDPRAYGFDVAIGASKAGHPKSYFSPHGTPDLPAEADGEYLTDRLTDEALAFLRADDDRPAFLLLSHYTVHTPIQPKAELRARYEQKDKGVRHRNAAYAAMVASLDDSVGKVLQHLEQSSTADRTVVVFTSDNGGLGRVTSMAPRGSKGMLYEGGIRVPLLVRWPGRIAAGARCVEPVALTDLLPTLLTIAGAQPPAEVVLDGRSLLPLLLGDSGWEERALFWHFPAYLEAAGRGGQGSPFRTRPVAAIRRGSLKLLEFFEDGRRELYDLASDPGESRDLAAERGDDVERLHGEMLAWRQRTAAPVPTERNPRFRGER